MAIHRHPRAVMRFLRQQYGVVPSMYAGGKHPHLIVHYGDRDHRFVLSATPSDVNATAAALQEIRQRLGPPPELASGGRVKRTMEEMMPSAPAPFNPPLKERIEIVPPAAAPTPIVYNARIAVYCDTPIKQRVKILVPLAIAERIGGVATRIEVTQLDDETWQLRRNSAMRAKFAKEGNMVSIAVVLPERHDIFGMSPAEATELDGMIVIVCPVATRIAVSTALRGRAAAKLAARPVPQPTQILVPAGPRHNPDIAGMRAILSAIDAWEFVGWRLIKVGGGWRFRMPDVSLDDDEVEK